MPPEPCSRLVTRGVPRGRSALGITIGPEGSRLPDTIHENLSFVTESRQLALNFLAPGEPLTALRSHHLFEATQGILQPVHRRLCIGFALALLGHHMLRCPGYEIGVRKLGVQFGNLAVHLGDLPC